MLTCPGPVWRLDDFTRCFQRDVLQTLIPLLLCGLSALCLCGQFLRTFTYRKAHAAYDPIPAVVRTISYQDSAARDDEPLDAESTEDEDGDGDEGPLLQLQPSISNIAASTVTIDRPRAELSLVLFELVAVLGETAIHLVALLTQAWGRRGDSAATAGLVVWLYVLGLSSARLMLSISPRQSFTILWNHTAFLYVTLWLSSILLLRSAIIHPRSNLAEVLTTTDFVLNTILAGIALTTKKGNKTTVVEHDVGLEAAREPLASLLSLATFSWVDAIVWRGYIKTYELEDIWDVAPRDKAVAILQNFRQVKKTTKLAWHLLGHFRTLLLLQAAFAAFGSVFSFAPTLLLKAILEYIEEPQGTPINAAWFYVILLFFSGCAQALGDGQALWIGRRICMRLRAIIIGEIYAKALRRKAASGNDTLLGADKSGRTKSGLVVWLKGFGQKKSSANKKSDNNVAQLPNEGTDSQANVGTITNLMAIDSFKVSEVSAYLHFLWSGVPVQIVLAIVLLYRILGYSSIAGIGIMILLLPLNIAIARGFSKFQKKIMAATDARIQTTNEVLQNIRIIKFFAWEQRFGNLVNEKRTTELRCLRNKFILWACASTVWYGAPLLITFLSFLIYTVVEKKELVPSVAFTALSLFSILRVPLDQLADMLAHVLEAKVSVDRVEEFLSEEETEKYDQLRQTRDETSGETLIGLTNVTCSWGQQDTLDDDSSPFKLMDIDVHFHPGELNVIAGPTGSGKTSLLMALLGEMTLLEGAISLPGGQSREDLQPDLDTGLTDSVAYCAQQAWLVNDTIKENILFASPLDSKRYDEVISACSLKRDMEILDAGDQTLVGEKGITLSGGQKQRISLARALYSRARHVLLDDCLSAVDSHTAKWIFDHCIMGPLMYDRTCILVTHNIALTVPHAKHVVVLENGRVTSQGLPLDVISSGMLGEEIQKSAHASKTNSQGSSRAASILDDHQPSDPEVHGENTNGALNGKINGAANGSTTAKADLPEDRKKTQISDLLAESKAVGGVKWVVIRLFIGAMGPWYYWLGTGVIFLCQQLGSVATNVWIREWANSYHARRTSNASTRQMHTSLYHMSNHAFQYTGSCLRAGTCVWNLPTRSSTNSLHSVSLESGDEVDVAYYLGIYGLIAIVFLVVSFFREIILFIGSLTASRDIHQRLLQSVTRAKLKFFDSTPLGQMINRFSKDIEAVDQEVATIALGTMHCLASVIMIVILISIITPKFLIAGVFISAMYFLIGGFYIRSSRDLKRLEAVQRSPLYQQFGETISGIITIRAYNDERRFTEDNMHRINTHNRPFIYLWATNRWLSFRVDFAGALVSFFAGAFVIMNAGKIDPGAAGLSLSYAITFNQTVLWLVRLYAVNEQNMNAVERIKEYLDVEQEASAVIPETEPAANWPSKGAVQFVDYSTRYRSDLDPVLKHVSFKIAPLEKVGVVGRTGAGKSSMALALFRGLEAETGKIIVDDVDIGLIGLQVLRESVTIVPQDPTLFTGTIRSNLDPFTLFTDEEIFTALRRVQLIGPAAAAAPSESGTSSECESVPSTPTTGTKSNKNIFLNLSSAVTESGNNLSQGQKQLLCLARAILKEPKVLIMDEATASIDYSTDAKIQVTIRELNSTTITIAHRLQTVIDYDKVLVLDQGEVKEFDHPHTLLQIEDGIFRGMCEMSGELESLQEGAKKAWHSRQLIDIETS
ncbi:MAG: hypothetical protein M1825_001048 [Sarcosagium campestre]|nr:MAG: hypothetical protein M1825_001048 [Sarcosagium campestre]